MFRKHCAGIICSTAMVLGLGMNMGMVVAQEKTAAPAALQAKPTIAKLCTNCHQSESGNLRGYFEGAAYQNESIQIRIDETTEILRFDPKTVKVKNVQPDPDNPSEPLRAIRKGQEVRVEYIEKDGIKFASEVSGKVPITVSAEMLMTTADVEYLVARGPEKGKYLLIDARPAPHFMEGAIPTAINIPFASCNKNAGKLPKDKSTLIIYYCADST